MKWFDNTSLTLVIIGAVNWLLIGIFRFDLVAFLFGNELALQNHIYDRRSVRIISDQLIWTYRFYVRITQDFKRLRKFSYNLKKTLSE